MNTDGTACSFEERLGAEHEQFDRRGELLRSINEYAGAPSPTASAGLVDPAAQPGTPAADAIQEWVFTFGSGQHLVPPPRYWADRKPMSLDDLGDVVNPPTGLDVSDRFVRITGTYLTARAEMHRQFGTAWCDQYPSEEAAGVARYNLRELT